MSHIVEVQTKVKDLEALEIGAGRLGLTLNRGQKKFRAYDRGDCTHALRLNDVAYEIGLLQQQDGSFKILYDDYEGARGLMNVVGDECRGLIDEYAIEIATKACAGLGWLSQRDGRELIVFHPSGGELRVSADRVDAFGFTGETCVEPSRAIAEALGMTVNETRKPEVGHITLDSVIPE